MSSRSDRADALLRAAEACGGVLTMGLASVVVPHVHRSVITRILQRLVLDGILVAEWQSFGQEKVWLTTSAPKGHRPGIRFVRGSTTEGNADARPITRRAGPQRYDGWDRPRAYLPAVVRHNLMAAILTYGFGTHGTQLDAEIPRGEADVKVPDGIAWATPSEALRIEVERLLGRTPSDWYRDNGIAEAVCAFAARHRDDPTEAQHLIACDAKRRSALVEAVNSVAITRGYASAAGEKWWWVPVEDVCGDLTEFHIGETNPAGSRDGIRTMQAKDPVRKAHQRWDQAIKERKAAKPRTEQSALARRPARQPNAQPTPTTQRDDGEPIPAKHEAPRRTPDPRHRAG